MQKQDAESSKHIRVPYVINEEVVEEEEVEGGDEGDEVAEKDSEYVKSVKQRLTLVRRSSDLCLSRMAQLSSLSCSLS